MIRLLVLAVTIVTSQAHGLDVKSATSCSRYPAFTNSFGFKPQHSYLNTSEVRRRGLVLVEKLPNGPQRVFQHPSWTKAGALGGMIFDEVGNVFTYPAPHVQLTYNPHEQTNTIFKADKTSGEMAPWFDLPRPQANASENPYGIIGIAYSCFSKSLYVSSVYGSTRLKTKGALYILNLASRTVIDSLSDFDGFGLAVVQIDSKNLLLAGSARNSDLYAIPLTAEGRFMGRPYSIASITGLGPRGDDKIKKLPLIL